MTRESQTAIDVPPGDPLRDRPAADHRRKPRPDAGPAGLEGVPESSATGFRDRLRLCFLRDWLMQHILAEDRRDTLPNL
ncbi:MAG: hypothetical protein ACLP7Q_03430 [Isosphaeraceae bacterium]